MLESFLSLTSVDDVLRMVAAFEPLANETVTLGDAPGRCLAEDITALEDIPPMARSTMDGFAVRARDVFGASEGLPALLECIGECRMGEVFSTLVRTGQCVRIWTGGMLPEGSDAVVMVEHAQTVGGNRVEVFRPVAPLQNVIERGEDTTKGEVVLQKGHVLRMQDVGILAALGRDRVCVTTRPKVAVISTGDEIVPVSATPKPGQIRDINTWTLLAHAESCGARARGFGLVPDDKKALETAVAEALAWADAVLVSGGSSVGSRDFTLAAVQAQPDSRILAHGVAISPGKPLIFARVGKKSVWGLPGHAASALVCAEVFIRPLLGALAGQGGYKAPWLDGVSAVLTRSVASTQGRRDYIRVALEALSEDGRKDGVGYAARPIRGKSGLISTLVKADGLVVCHEDLEGLEEGELVRVQLFSGRRAGA